MLSYVFLWALLDMVMAVGLGGILARLALAVGDRKLAYFIASGAAFFVIARALARLALA